MTLPLSGDHLSDDQARLLRLRAQRLQRPRSDSAASAARVVSELCSVQAQDAAAASLAIRARGDGLLATDVERTRLRDRSLVRTWGMRGTLHLLATEDLGWLLRLLGDVFIRTSRRRYAELGLDEDTCARGIRMIQTALAGAGPLTRAEIVDRLAARGVQLAGQARPHLIRRAALEGIVCCGPDRGATPTYVLLDDWADRGPAMTPEAAQSELARRYLAAYGPATPADFAAWSGLSIGATRAGWRLIADELIEVEVSGQPAWMLATCAAWLHDLPPCGPVVRLLPSFDTYLLGYRSRDLAVAPEHARRIHPGGGIVHPALLGDGRAVATWSSKRLRNGLDLVVEPFDALNPDVYAGLEAEAEGLACFLGATPTVRLTVLPASTSDVA